MPIRWKLFRAICIVQMIAAAVNVLDILFNFFRYASWTGLIGLILFTAILLLTILAVNLLNKLYVGLDYQVLKKLSLTFGATLNGHVTENAYDGYFPLFTDYQPNVFYDRNFSDYNLKMWLGGKVGVRFL